MHRSIPGTPQLAADPGAVTIVGLPANTGPDATKQRIAALPTNRFFIDFPL